MVEKSMGYTGRVRHCPPFMLNYLLGGRCRTLQCRFYWVWVFHDPVFQFKIWIVKNPSVAVDFTTLKNTFTTQKIKGV